MRVVEFGPYVAAPLLGMLLADQGAEVVHVAHPERPGTPWGVVLHRGKQRLSLDLSERAHQLVAREVVARADVVVDGFRPGVLERMGIDHEEIRAEDNPALVSCALPGFAAEDPRSDLPAWEGVIGTMMGLYESPLRRRPLFTPITIASVTAALYAATAVGMALYAQERDGEGQHVAVPLYDATFAVHALTALFTMRPPRSWTPAQWGATPFIGAWRAGDGRWVYLHAGLPKHLGRFLDVVEEMGHVRQVASMRRVLSEQTLADPIAVGTVREAMRIQRLLRGLFRRRPAAEWEERLAEAGLCAVVPRTPREWLAHPQARASGQVVALRDPHLGEVVQPGMAVWLSRTPGAPRPRTADSVAVQTLLESWDQRDTPSQPERAESAPPLQGLRVLDLSQVIAGPTAGRTLAEFGAEVLRIENPHLDAPWVAAFHTAFNAGKRSVALDLASDAGREAFWRVVEDFEPDVVLDSYRGGVAARLGVDPSRLRKQIPGVVITHISAYGSEGPWRGRPGWEHTAQALTGVQMDYGGASGPQLVPLTFTDLGTGLLATFGTVLALLHRRRTGETQEVEARLSATATLMQSTYLFDHRGKPWDHARGQDALGWGPLHRFYQARDGWLFFGAPEQLVPDLAQVPGLGSLDETPRDHWDRALAAAFATAPISVWRARIQAAGLAHRVAVVRRVRPSTALGDPRALTQGLVRSRRHAGVGRVTEVGTPVTLSRTPLQHLRPAPPRSADTRDVLERLGLQVPDGAPLPEDQVEDPSWSVRRELEWAGVQLKWALYLASMRVKLPLRGR
ncbi:MAG: CoA transferase [Deltaproteobacteria bacterium]|nr:CoA transferase [Deltaproteobacteria bacterium]